MKRETIIGIALLLLLVAFASFGGEVASVAIYMLGCFTVGWNIPEVSQAIEQRFFERG